MNSENDLMQKLMISKKIMDKHNNMERGQSRNINMGDHSFSSPMVEDYQSPAGKYNIPQEFMGEQEVQVRPKSYGVPSEDRIVNSKLPDEIKKLMIEHPIQQPNMGMGTESVLSNDLVVEGIKINENRCQR